MSTKISALPPSAGLVLTDIFPVVDDPGGVPVTQRATFTQLQTLLGTGNFVLKSGDTMTGNLTLPQVIVNIVSFPNSATVTEDGSGNIQLINGGGSSLTLFPTGVQIEGASSTVAGESPLTVIQEWNSFGEIHDGVAVNITDILAADANSTLLKLTSSAGDTFIVKYGGRAELAGLLMTFDSLAIPVGSFPANGGLEVYSGAFPGTLVHRIASDTVGFFGAAAVTQQAAPTPSLAEVVAALKAYGLLAP